MLSPPPAYDGGHKKLLILLDLFPGDENELVEKIADTAEMDDLTMAVNTSRPEARLLQDMNAALQAAGADVDSFLSQKPADLVTPDFPELVADCGANVSPPPPGLVRTMCRSRPRYPDHRLIACAAGRSFCRLLSGVSSAMFAVCCKLSNFCESSPDNPGATRGLLWASCLLQPLPVATS